MQSAHAVAATAVHHVSKTGPCVAGDDGGIPQALKKYVDGSAQLPVNTYFIGGYGEWLVSDSNSCRPPQHTACSRVQSTLCRTVLMYVRKSVNNAD